MKLACAGIALALAALAPAPSAADNAALSISDAWISAPPPGVEVAAAYLELHNRTGSGTTLTRVTSPRFGNIEVHVSVVKNGIASMSRQESVAIPAGTSLSFATGGYHLMLFHPSPLLQPGENVPLSFEFSGGVSVNTEAIVRPPQAADSAHAH